MRKYELFNDVDDTGDWIKIDLNESGITLGFDRFKGVIVTDKQKKELKNNLVKQFEITMDYLSDLLRKGKI